MMKQPRALLLLAILAPPAVAFGPSPLRAAAPISTPRTQQQQQPQQSQHWVTSLPSSRRSPAGGRSDGGCTALAALPAKATITIDLDRISPMLSAMSSYAVVASLLMGSGLYLFAITPLKYKDYQFAQTRRGWSSKVERTAIMSFSVVSAVSIATSLRTVIIFQFMTLYGNTALGHESGKEIFAKFWYSDLCINMRRSGFRSFLGAIHTFRTAFALSVFLKTDGRHRWVATTVAILIMVMTGVQTHQLIELASSTIFL